MTGFLFLVATLFLLPVATLLLFLVTTTLFLCLALYLELLARIEVSILVSLLLARHARLDGLTLFFAGPLGRSAVGERGGYKKNY